MTRATYATNPSEAIEAGIPTGAFGERIDEGGAVHGCLRVRLDDSGRVGLRL